MPPTPDVSVSIGMDYAAFQSQANGASSKALQQALKNFSLHAKEASVIAGTGAARATAASGLLSSLAAPVTGPFLAGAATVAATVAVARQAARISMKTFAREFQLKEAFAKAAAPLRAAVAPFTKALSAPFVGSIQSVRKQRLDLRAAMAEAAQDMTAKGGSVREAERKFTLAQHRVQQKIQQLSRSTGIKNTSFAFWQHDPRVQSQIGQMDKAAAGVQKARDAFQSSAGAAATARQAATGFVTGLKQVATVVVSGVGSAFRILGAIVSGVFSIIGTVIRGVISVVTSLGRSLLVIGALINTAMAIGVARAVSYGKELDALARKSGYTAAQIETMRLAMFRSNQTAASTTDIMAKMRESMFLGVGPTLIQQLGINLDQLSRMAPVDQFATLADVINRIPNPIQRAAVATELLGAAGADAIAQFQKGDANLSPALRKYVDDLAKGISGMQMAADHWKRIKLSVEVFFSIIAAKLAPVLEYIGDYFENVLIPMAEDWGSTLGDKLTTAFQIAVGLFASGQITEALKIGFELAVRFFANMIIQVIVFAGNIMQLVFSKAFDLLLDGNLFAGLLQMFKSLGSGIIAVLMDAFETPLRYFQDRAQAVFEWIMEKWDSWFGEGKFKASSFEQIHKENAGQKPQLQTAEGPKTAKDFAAEAGKFFSGFNFDVNAFGDLLKQIPELWDKSASDLFSKPELVAKLSALLADAQKRGAALTAGTGAKPKPGDPKLGPATGLGYIQTRFDDLRRVGGNIAGGAVNVMQTIAQRQLDTQIQIAAGIKVLAGTAKKPAPAGGGGGPVGVGGSTQ